MVLMMTIISRSQFAEAMMIRVASWHVTRRSDRITVQGRRRSDPKVQAADFIDVIKEDPTLSVELLRVATGKYDIRHAEIY